ncbi:MAG TPA: DNA gyrase inhibitor YacG [Gallionellaceae bacterium]|nr:DNA gyrase inhibitor YacG [Gallionellaceae bacterium]
MDSKKPAVVACPQCGKEVIWNKEVSPYRPFCSERCKLIDLGQWAEGGYSIPLEEKSDEDLQTGEHHDKPHQA